MELFERYMYAPIFEKNMLIFFSKNVGIVLVMLPTH